MHTTKGSRSASSISIFVIIMCLSLGRAQANPPTGLPGDEPFSLSLAKAVDMALENNLQTMLAAERIYQSKGERSIGLAGLLPNLSGSASQQSFTINLAALGIPVTGFPGIPAFAGPTDRFDARLQLVQSVFNLASIWRYRVGTKGVSVAAEQKNLAAQQVISAVTLAYISCLEAEQTVQTAQANTQLAQRLLDLAMRQRDKGTATGLDVVRAETRLANQQVQLAQAQTGLDTARTILLRLIGAPLSQRLVLTESMGFAPFTLPELDVAIRQAQSDRLELRVAERQLRLAESLRNAAMADWLPSISFFGDYGSSGLKPDVLDLPTRSIGIRLDVPLFDGGRTRGQIAVAASQARQARLQLSDLRAEVEKDVRVAFENVATREGQVKAAQKAVSLAERELELSRDRFANGVADNIEVVNAQTALENARLILVSSTGLFNVARLHVEAALGHAEAFRF